MKLWSALSDSFSPGAELDEYDGAEATTWLQRAAAIALPVAWGLMIVVLAGVVT